MDYYIENREPYIGLYIKYSKVLKLNDKLIASVKKFCPSLWNVDQERLDQLKITSVKEFLPLVWSDEEGPSDEHIKAYILLELTNNRESCTKIIQLLRESGEVINCKLADDLEKFNTSPGRKTFGDEINIKVTHILPKYIKLANSINYPFTKNPRGKAVIINNVPDDVKREAQRFEHIFKEFMFEVRPYTSLSVSEIKDLLEGIADEIVNKKVHTGDADQALIVMIITHGADQRMVGINHPACGGTDVTDVMPTIDIVDIFANIEDLVKMFFFTRCNEIYDLPGETHPMDKNCTFHDYQLDNNTDTIRFNSCAEGYETFIEPGGLYTNYGRVLSETFAQYAHKENLVSMANRTYQTLRGIDPDMTMREVGNFAPENNQKALSHSVFFNPGWYEGKNQ